METSSTNPTQRIDIKGLKGEITVRLCWKRTNFFQRVFGGGNIDLDLGCYCKMRDGRHTLIDCLQFGNVENTDRNHPSKQGCFTMPPYVWHAGNNHGEALSNEEQVLINTRGLPMIEKLLLYIFIYEGEPLWHKAKISLDIILRGRGIYNITLDREQTEQRFCAVAELQLVDEHFLEIKPLMTFHDGHADCDNHYQWGFRYHKPIS